MKLRKELWFGFSLMALILAAIAVVLGRAETITNGHLVAWDSLYAAVSCPTTGNTARAVGVAQNGLSSGDYFWAMIAGQSYVKAGASVAAGTPVGVTATGTAVRSAAAGAQPSVFDQAVEQTLNLGCRQVGEC